MKQLRVTHKLAAALTAGVLVSQGTDAFAQAVGFKTLTTNIADSASTLPTLISTVSYIGGVGLGVAGVFKLKQHVDQPSQHPLKDGLVRLGAGGGLLALPFLTNMMMGTINNGDTNQAAQKNMQSFDTTVVAP